MRKLIRSMLRLEAERKGIKASKYVASAFHAIQVTKYGGFRRSYNQKIASKSGTRPMRGTVKLK